MATRRQPLIPGWLWPGLLTALLLLAVALSAFTALWQNASATAWQPQNDWLRHVIFFTFWQALLSTLLSIVPAIPLARALFRRRFPGRTLLLRLCAMTLVLPVLVAVFGLLSVYGRTGWLAWLCTRLGWHYTFSPYGLQGILLAHLFFNLPLAVRLLLQALSAIPGEQRQLAAQLGISGMHLFRLVEWPWLRRQLLPGAALIFMLCFASFAAVLALGGGPQSTTIELAIYQALSYDYDPATAALLALLQMGCCLGLVLLSQRLNKAMPVTGATFQRWRAPPEGRGSLLADVLAIGLLLLLLLPPLLAVFVDGLKPGLLNMLHQPALWQATVTSLCIALVAGMLAVTLTLLLLWSSRQLRLRNSVAGGQLLELSGMLILAMPAIVLATGLFLLLRDTVDPSSSAFSIVILTNALMAIPWAMNILAAPVIDLADRYDRLCLSLDLRGWRRFRLTELRLLKRPLARALAFAAVLSVGDLGAVALFGSEHFRTLPFYLYQQTGAYRSADAAVTALLLLLLCLLLFTLIEKIAGCHADTE